jgi:arsenate reductase (thioredoxin)
MKRREAIMKRQIKILFFSTGNATRSRMAEAFLRGIFDDRLVAASTAVRSVEANPLAVDVMKEVGIDITQQHAKPVAQSFKEHYACVVTLSDDSEERRPVWPFTSNIVHWSLKEPMVNEGPLDVQRQAFRRMRDEIQRLVQEFASRVAPKLLNMAR